VSTLEDRLRDAYRAVADTVDPATVPGLTVRTKPRAALSRRMRFVMPLAAAAAVIVVATMSTLLVGGSPRSHTRTAKARAVAAVSLPEFTLVDLGSSLMVYNTHSGARVATVAAPAGQQFEEVASGGTARTFLAATGLSVSACHAYFYRFELAATGKPSPLTLLRSIPGSQPTAVAATPGGGSYAYSTVHCDTAPNGLIGISGQAGNRTWAYDQGDDYTFSLAATADGDTLALSLLARSRWSDLLLNTRSSAATVDNASRILPAVPYAQTLAISPDGRTLYACVDSGPMGTLAAYSTATGAQIRVLHLWPLHSQGFACQISIDPTGRFLLAAVASNIQQPSTLIGFDLRTGASATLPVHHPALHFRGGQLAW
jgi:hypothetical protein